MIFPIITSLILIAENSGAWYWHNQFCGIPGTFTNLITWAVAMVERKRKSEERVISHCWDRSLLATYCHLLGRGGSINRSIDT
jgi:hypothetical protein